MLLGDAEKLLRSRDLASLHGKVQLIFTSPPFPLNRKKKYGMSVVRSFETDRRLY